MGIRLVIVTPELNWSSRKIDTMVMDLKVLLNQEGCRNPEITVLPGDAEIPSFGGEKEKPVYLLLQHPACRVAWYSDRMEACPECGARRGVAKGASGRVPLPEGAALGKTFDPADLEVVA